MVCSHTKVKVLFKDCIFHMAISYWFVLHFSHILKNWISNLKPNITYNMIKTEFFLHQTLHSSQIYNYTLNHDYKFKTIIVLKDIQVLESKKTYVFQFFECFEHMDPFLWNILKFTKKLKWFNEHLIREKYLLHRKHTCPHAFLKCFKHIKGLVKHAEFS
jgi:hypothetical protein